MCHNPQLEWHQTAFFFSFFVPNMRLFTRISLRVPYPFLAPPSQVSTNGEIKLAQGSIKLSQEGKIRSGLPAAIKSAAVNLYNTSAQTGDPVASQLRDRDHIIRPSKLPILWVNNSFKLHNFAGGTAQSRLKCPPFWQSIATKAPTHRPLLQLPKQSSTLNIIFNFRLNTRGYHYAIKYNQQGPPTKKESKGPVFDSRRFTGVGYIIQSIPY